MVFGSGALERRISPSPSRSIIVVVFELLGQIGVMIVSSVYSSMAHTLVCLKTVKQWAVCQAG